MQRHVPVELCYSRACPRMMEDLANHFICLHLMLSGHIPVFPTKFNSTLKIDQVTKAIEILLPTDWLKIYC